MIITRKIQLNFSEDNKDKRTDHTSQTCAVCGHYEKGQREEQAKFVCKNESCSNFGVAENADYNGAVNIAKSIKVVTRKEECEYFKRTSEKSEAAS